MADDIDRLRTQVDASILRAALVAIQELHKRDGDGYCSHYECHDSYGDQLRFPCETRRLADDALTARTTKNGDA